MKRHWKTSVIWKFFDISYFTFITFRLITTQVASDVADMRCIYAEQVDPFYLR